jgi:sterol desaturase/sphingolipid hydroxylase (fatty acid hydroxylase superfamily)
MHELISIAGYWGQDAAENLRRYAIFAIGVWLAIWVLGARLLAARKIREASPPARQLVTEFLVSLRSIAIFSTSGTLLFAMERAGLLPGPGLAARWGLAWAVAVFVLMVLAHDAWFYWTHRAMHDPRLFRAFHRRHHRSGNPSPFSAYSFDLAEAAVQAGFVFVWMVLIPTPWAVTGLFMLHQIARNTLGHSGYELYPARRDGRPLFDFMTTTTHHDLHHAQAGWNYGLYFTWWDRLMGTEHPEYHARFAAAAGRRIPTESATAAGPALSPLPGRTLGALVLAGLLSTGLAAATGRPAGAQEVRLNLAGKDEAAARREIRRSVEAVCRQADREGGFRGIYTLQDCLMNAETDAMRQYRAYRQTAASPPPTLASAAPQRPQR